VGRAVSRVACFSIASRKGSRLEAGHSGGHRLDVVNRRIERWLQFLPGHWAETGARRTGRTEKVAAMVLPWPSCR